MPEQGKVVQTHRPGLTVYLSHAEFDYLKALLQTGLYGGLLEDVAERLVAERLRQLGFGQIGKPGCHGDLIDGFVQYFSGRETLQKQCQCEFPSWATYGVGASEDKLIDKIACLACGKKWERIEMT